MKKDTRDNLRTQAKLSNKNNRLKTNGGTFVTVEDLSEYNEKIIELIDRLFSKSIDFQERILKLVEFVLYPVLIAIVIVVFLSVYLFSTYIISLYKSADSNTQLIALIGILVPILTFFLGRKSKKQL